MGISDTHAGSLWGRTRLGLLVGLTACGCVLALVSMFSSGCESNSGKGVVSAAGFLTAETDKSSLSGGLRQLTNELELLKAITPDVLEDELAEQSAKTIPVGKLSPKLLAVYESQQTAILSVDLCPDCSTTGGRSQVFLHYDRDGLGDELRDRGVEVALPALDTNMPALEVRTGDEDWLIVYESISKSLIALHRVDGHRPVNPVVPSLDANFARGNGVVLNVVISGIELARQIEGNSPTNVAASVTRMFALDSGRLLLFLPNRRALHLLELSVDFENIAPDLGNPSAVQPTEVLTGTVRTFPNPDPTALFPLPFLTFSEIQRVTQFSAVNVDDFQPILIPTDGSALLFDEASLNFLRLRQRPGRGRGILEVAVRSLTVRLLSGGSSVLSMDDAWYHAKRDTILVIEEENNNIFEYDFNLLDVDNSLSLFSEGLRFSRDPALPPGTFVPGGGELPGDIVASRNDILENRPAYDLGRDHLLAISYDTGQAVVVAKRGDFEGATGRGLADLTFLEVLTPPSAGQEDVRAWDGLSNSLLEIALKHITLPITVRGN